MIKAHGDATIKSSGSKTVCIKAQDMAWGCVSSTERQMGTERVWLGQPAEGDFQFLKWTVHEYPAGKVNTVEHDLGHFTLTGEFSFEFD